MNTVKIEKGGVRMIAHRGLSGIEKENTNAAFVAAGNRSYFGVETDIHKTADGKFILIHNDTTAASAIDDLAVEKSTFDTLRSLAVVDIDGKRGRSDLRLPTLSEYLGICAKYEKVAVLELKNTMTEDEVLTIADEVAALGCLDRTIFISFSLDNLLFLRKKYPAQPAEYLVGSYTDELPALLQKHKLDLDIKYTALTEGRVRACHAVGALVNVWTVNTKEDGERMVAMGVDMITTNILE